MSIVLARVDDRLIHGQVVTSWIAHVGAEKIVIVDDIIVKDIFMVNMLKKLAPMGTSVDIYGVMEAVETLKEYDENINLKTIILVKSPQPILSLVENGVKLTELIVGGMGIRSGRRKLFRNISASDEEREIMKQLNDLGCKVYCQILPAEKPQNVMQLI